MALQLRVYVPDHPLIKHWLAIARDHQTPSVMFKSAMTELGRWLTYEAVRNWLPVEEVEIQTPLAPTSGVTINPQMPMAVVPILRAGLALLDGAQTVLPIVSTYHLGLSRDEETLQPTCYLDNLPQEFPPQTRIIILDPLLATGGSIMTAMEKLTNSGADPSLMRIVSVVAAPPALQKLGQTYPSLNIYTAIIDEALNEQGFVVPGLGDAGDRAFGTEVRA